MVLTLTQYLGGLPMFPRNLMEILKPSSLVHFANAASTVFTQGAIESSNRALLDDTKHHSFSGRLVTTQED
jgi:hypothetical protein